MSKMTFKKINNYTWIPNDGKKSLQERQKLLDEKSLSKSNNYLKDKKNRRPVDQNKLYKKFINEVFEHNRKFISQKEFYQLIREKFNVNTTWYRDRMVQLGYITVHNKLIKVVKNENNQSSEESEENKNEN